MSLRAIKKRIPSQQELDFGMNQCFSLVLTLDSLWFLSAITSRDERAWFGFKVKSLLLQTPRQLLLKSSLTDLLLVCFEIDYIGEFLRFAFVAIR